MRSRTKRSSILALCGLALSALALAGCKGAGGPGGRYLLTVGDADMAASAFANNDLGQRDETNRDTLTMVAFPITEPITRFAQIEVSNSALCPPTCLSVTKDGRYAFVVEYRGMAPPNAKTVADLPVGNTLTAVDLVNPMAPVICATIEVSKEPIAVAVHPDGDLVAVVAQSPRQQIVVVPFKNGQFTGEPTAWPLLGLDNDEAKPTSIAWHPAGKLLAVTLQDRGEVMFYEFKRSGLDGGGMAISPWGEPVKVGKAPFSGAFTPDGRHFIVNDLKWGKDVEGYNVGAPEGELFSIRLGDMAAGTGSSEGGPAPSVVVSSVNVGVSPVGIAINSDGNLLATANLKRSYLPDGDPRLGTDEASRGGSISLVMISSDGTLTNIGESPINAMPAGICFDAQNRYICVTQFRSFDADAVDGEVGFWKITNHGSTPSLDAAEFFVGVGKGPHGVLIVR
jgi:YD repeat-containing protein